MTKKRLSRKEFRYWLEQMYKYTFFGRVKLKPRIVKLTHIATDITFNTVIRVTYVT